jgi:hypothetical protein
LFDGQFDQDHQVTSVDLGNVPGGLFWTFAYPPENVSIDQTQQTALMTGQNLELPDFHDNLNDLTHGPSVPCVTSFTVRWANVIQEDQLRDEENRFNLRLLESAATVEFTLSEATFDYVSDPPETSAALFAGVGLERNGAFFR